MPTTCILFAFTKFPTVYWSWFPRTLQYLLHVYLQRCFLWAICGEGQRSGPGDAQEDKCML